MIILKLSLAKMVIVRSVLSIATIRGWHLHQFDVINALLHGDLVEEIHMNKLSEYTENDPQLGV